MNISFVVPAYNESEHIERCLSSIKALSSKFGIVAEIIVIDNGSTDESAKLSRKYTDKVFTISKSKVSVARNFGADKASNELVAFIDGDVELKDSWGQHLVLCYEKLLKSPYFVTGAQCLVPEDGGWIEKYWFSNLKDKFLGGANILTSKVALLKIGGFDESLETGEDYDFCLRAIECESVRYSADEQFEAVHLGFPKDIENFARRELWHGMGDVNTFDHFISSPVAILSLIYGFTTIIFLSFLLVGSSLVAFIIVGTLLLANFSITVLRFKRAGLNVIICNSFLNAIYFYARFGSIYRRCKDYILI